MSKVVNEATAKSFQKRTGFDIYGLRINNVIEPHEYKENFSAYLQDPDLRRRNIFSYIDARDLGQMVQKCLERDGLGYQIFNVSNDDHSVGLSSAEIMARYAMFLRSSTCREFLFGRKGKTPLGFMPEHS